MGEVVIDHQVVVLDVMAHLADRFAHALLDDLVAVLAAVVQALAQSFLGRREDEDRLGLRHQPAHLLGTLPVDFQNQVEALGQGLLQPALRGTVEVAEHFGMFEELVALQTLEKILAADEVVVHAVDLARAHGASRVRNRHPHLRLCVDQGLDQAGLAGPGRRGHDVKRTGGGGHDGFLEKPVGQK